MKKDLQSFLSTSIAVPTLILSGVLFHAGYTGKSYEPPAPIKVVEAKEVSLPKAEIPKKQTAPKPVAVQPTAPSVPAPTPVKTPAVTVSAPTVTNTKQVTVRTTRRTHAS